MKKTIWTDDSIAYLKENYPYTTDTAIAQHLCVNRKTVSLKAKELGLEKGIRPEWLDLAERVRELHDSHSNAEIAAITGISSRSVSRIVAVLGLRRTKKEEQNIRSRIRQDIMKREKRRVIFGLPPITRIKVVTNKPRIKMRHSLKKAGYLVIRGQNVMYYHPDMERDHSRENIGRKLGLRFEPWDNCNNKLCVNF
ncbi:hypothetical protein EEL50_14030 [Muribaculaceae bacterium Isolate-105 (HZI)]|nr:hypothetical protein [uncultured Bacteroides sp.]ROT11456.1 hypothetical protein EEL50_14030 [Muribaculaceae bacterium Isolate-105 (HZI)]